MRQLSATALVILAVASTQAACDPSTALSECFQRFGLNRVALLRDDIRVGAVVLSKGKTAVYADNVSDYVRGQDQVLWKQTSADYASDFNAALASCSSEKSFAPELALGVVDSILPVKVSGKLKLSTKVSVDQIDGKGIRIPIPDINNYLVSAASKSFRDQMQQYLDAGVRTYVAYETIAAKKLKMTAAGGQDIGGGFELNKTTVIAEGKFSVEIKKTSSSTIELDAGRYYITAIRTGELIKGKTASSLRFSPLKFQVPGKTVKAVQDASFSALITAPGEALAISDERPSVLLGGRR